MNIIASFHGPFGYSECARKLVKALKHQGIPFSLLSMDKETGNHPVVEQFDEPISNQFVYPINLICLDKDLTPVSIGKFGAKNFSRTYNIGIPYWETDVVPKKWVKNIDFLDELWVATDYLHTCFSKVTHKPIHKIPQPIYLENKACKDTFGLPDKFTFLFMFNYYSIFERKNPLALIKAFQKAFPEDDVQLVIKTQSAHKHPQAAKQLEEAAKGDPRIIVMDKQLNSGELYALVERCDCYVSLHRSEGLGLTMAEAMLLEKPVIATAYSGNVDFTNVENSYPCSYRLTKIGPGLKPYPAQGSWADVDIEEAARHMQRVYRHPEEARQKAIKGKETIQRLYSEEHIGKLMGNRLKEISPPNTSKSISFRTTFLYRLMKTKQMIKPLYNTLFNV